MLYETLLNAIYTVKIRVRANSPEEAEEIYQEFESKEPDYLAEEIDIAATGEWFHTEFKETHPSRYDECATITKNEDGSFDAMYEGG